MHKKHSEKACKCEEKGKATCDDRANKTFGGAVKAELLQQKEVKIEELTNDLKRVQAEFENYQKRVEQDFIAREQRIRSNLLGKMISILDALDEGIKHEKDNKGLTQVKEVLVKFLHNNGVEKMTKKVGDKFDHNEMECMLQGKDEKKEDGEILEVLQKGYFINDKVLRFAKVKVNKL
jgi:molecular chaperone GrpE